MSSILVVEDDQAFSELLGLHLEDLGYQVRVAPSLEAARRLLGEERPDALLLDYRLPDGVGTALLEELHGRQPALPIILITGMGDTDLAIESIKAGAYDYIRKPLDTNELDTILRGALRMHRPARGVSLAAATASAGVDGIAGGSRAIIDVCKTIGRVAPSNACVLLSGESGTGKEVIARAIHHHSGRTGAFLPINCSAIVETLLENELFGHEKGSYTGASARKEGKFELAADGTLFLDEIGDLPMSLQAKLLRVLQEGSFERVGGNETLHTNARIIAATNRELRDMVEHQVFREDLYYRLNVVTIHLPPLRERPEDLPQLLQHLLARIQRNLNKSLTRVTEDAWRAMAAHPWPGNVRELENVLTRAVVLAQGDTLTADLLGLPGPDAESDASAPPDQSEEDTGLLSLDALEARHVRRVMEHTHWHKGKACAILGISRPALERKLSKYHLQ